MIKHLQKVSALALVGFAFLANTEANAQANPVAQSLPFNMNFNEMQATETLPDGIAVWLTAYNNSKAAAEASTPSADAPILATSDKQTSGSKAYNYTLNSNNRLYIQLTANTSNGSNQLATAINTTGKSNIQVAYDVELVNNQPRSVGVTLQYRVKTENTWGTWTTIAGTDYTSVNKSTEGDIESYRVSLPTEAENKADVQLRWATYENVAEGVTGSRDGIAFDNIVISEATTTGIADATKGMFSIYPNPMQNQNVRLSLPGHVGSQKVNLTVWSVEGKALVQASGSQAQVQATLNEKMAALPKGMFFVNVTAGSEIYQTKLLKN